MTNASTVVTTLRGIETRTLRSAVTSSAKTEEDAQLASDGRSAEAAEDAALIHAEEKLMLEDEEISSHDGSGNPVVDTEKLENRMLTVAIVKSVMESAPSSGGGGESPNSHGYGLRKRRRPALPKGEESPRSPAGGGRSTRSKGSDAVQPPSSSGSPRTARANARNVKKEEEVAPSSAKPAEAAAPALKPESSVSAPVLAKKDITRIPVAIKKEAPKPAARLVCTSVPNPLANSTPPPTVTAPTAPVVSTQGTGSTAAAAATVACPLSAPAEAQSSSAVPKAQPEQTVSAPAGTTEVRVRRGRIFSIDIDPAGLDFPDLGIVGTMNQQSELSKTPPLPPISATVSGGAPPPVTTSSAAQVPSHPQERSVGFTAAPPRQQKTESAATGVDATNTDLFIVGRDRAMSFEFFSFGLNHDEPLPPASDAPHGGASSEITGRPRGDSIIFDPCSFRDGGILEENGLLKSRGNSIDIALNDETLMMNEPGFVTAHTGVAAQVHVANDVGVHAPGKGTSYILSSRNDSSQIAPAPPSLTTTSTSLVKSHSSAVQMATLPSSLSGSSISHSTFQMELLNKDGRIGIYLPEARKARIAKFHSKRKMRIWRKRIKYDCRKKLADSRPRIKGRFVKRSDMEEEED